MLKYVRVKALKPVNVKGNVVPAGAVGMTVGNEGPKIKVKFACAPEAVALEREAFEIYEPE